LKDVLQLTNRKTVVTEKFFDMRILPYFAGNGLLNLRSGSNELKIIYLVPTFRQPSQAYVERVFSAGGDLAAGK